MKQVPLLLLCAAHAFASEPFSVGQKDFVFNDPVRHRKIATHVWYPG